MTSFALTELEDQPYEFVISLSAAENSSACNRKMGWEKIGELQTMDWHAGKRSDSFRRIARRLPVLPAVYHYFRSRSGPPPLSAEPSPPFHMLEQNIDRPRHVQTSQVILEKTPRPEAMAALAECQGNDGRIRHVRDEKFYRWRFRNPRCNYRFLFVEKAGLEGYLVLQQDVHISTDAVCIVDWEATSVEVFSDLVRTAIHGGGFQSVGIWSTTLSAVLRKMLSECGFRSAGENGSAEPVYVKPVLVKPLRAAEGLLMGGRSLSDISNWDLRAIYSDSY
jgi:hypothetical protein